MSWLDSAWKYRAAISVDNVGWVSGTIDAALPIPADWEVFWKQVQSTGNDVRVCLSDGALLATYDLDNWNATNRTGTVEINDFLPKGAGTQLFWLYWGNALAGDARTAFVPDSPKPGAIELAVPRSRVVVAKPERPGDTKPATVLSKMSAEAVTVWWDFRSLLHARRDTYNKSSRHEEVDCTTYDVRLNDGSQASMIDATKTRLLDGAVGTLVKAGTSGQTYTVLCRATTTQGRTLEARALMKVQDPKE